MADVTPVIPAGRQVIETYGENRFHVSGVRYVHSLLVLPEQVIEWAPRPLHWSGYFYMRTGETVTIQTKPSRQLWLVL